MKEQAVIDRAAELLDDEGVASRTREECDDLIDLFALMYEEDCVDELKSNLQGDPASLYIREQFSDPSQ